MSAVRKTMEFKDKIPFMEDKELNSHHQQKLSTYKLPIHYSVNQELFFDVSYSEKPRPAELLRVQHETQITEIENQLPMAPAHQFTLDMVARFDHQLKMDVA